ncbi:MAG: family 65 glycosyl hydrolase [Planctomycetota bacterium]|nr:MAG: family 65 glycosyl hydrolase [Planctomycetota bacterium]
MSGAWRLVYEGFEPAEQGRREALCALGNGVFVTRGAWEEAEADGTHYPGTYLAGGYDRATSRIAGRTVVNEDLVNFPNWLVLRLAAAGGAWFAPGTAEVLQCRTELDLRAGVLARSVRLRDPAGRTIRVRSRRLVHMGHPHLAAIEYQLTAEDWEGEAVLASGLDGTVTNAGVARYRALEGKHLETLARGAIAPAPGQSEPPAAGIFLLVRTLDSHLELCQAARTRLFDAAGRPIAPLAQQVVEEPEAVAERFAVKLERGRPLVVEKVVALRSSRDRALYAPAHDAPLELGRAGSFAELLAEHTRAWQELWRRYDVAIELAGEQKPGTSREQLILRLHIFHLLQTISPHTVGLDVGAPARGWHGEAYRGHIFWDELFILPFFNLRSSRITRSLLMYRYHRLEAARAHARQAGYRGAMYPWQSSSNGEETTQQLHLNPRSGRWDPDHSQLQRHIGAAVAYNVWQYFEVSGDVEFLENYGAEMLLEIARFFSSVAQLDPASGRYEIAGVMGPDEYHEKYPGAAAGGLRNNAYTNVMAVWCLQAAFAALAVLRPERGQELLERLGIDEAERARWRDIMHRMKICFHDGVISQFEGFEQLQELDWERYRARYRQIERLDRILKAEGDSPDRYKVSKQADVLMLWYLLTPRQLRQIFRRLGYPFDDGMLARHLAYYEPRTSHGSTLSKVVHASLVDRLDRARGWELFCEALRSDIRRRAGRHHARGHPSGGDGGHGRHRAPPLRRPSIPAGTRWGCFRACPRSWPACASASSTATSGSGWSWSMGGWCWSWRGRRRMAPSRCRCSSTAGWSGSPRAAAGCSSCERAGGAPAAPPAGGVPAPAAPGQRGDQPAAAVARRPASSSSSRSLAPAIASRWRACAISAAPMRPPSRRPRW